MEEILDDGLDEYDIFVRAPVKRPLDQPPRLLPSDFLEPELITTYDFIWNALEDIRLLGKFAKKPNNKRYNMMLKNHYSNLKPEELFAA